MTVFPYFSSEQLSRIIITLNQVILHETELSIILSKLSMLEGKKLTNRILKTRILTEPIPSFVSSIHVQDQVIICEEPNLFIVQFTNTVSISYFFLFSSNLLLIPQ